ncbi:protoheme IX farnesyltransferase [Archaeoglobus sulfaticallidus PM70-1]|uniref:Protoheme IX farnesyltransferase n=1 Tax=Archaeoglobus sulfaticallidus PM70-1 TaxID=387631 RepID=N0BLG1_9EURY|nr:heme o synthase [Archaeoglobus sulfaticallidus]AGK61020.1 protoheme IX farnesyltransferase [Archaeoglobus sulfaticallidus PM70-1]
MDLKAFVEVTKPKQTLLLMITCIMSFLVASGFSFHPVELIKVFLAVSLAVAGTTALNMVLDRDIDILMPRTMKRPVPSGRLPETVCAIYGTLLFLIGIAISYTINIYVSIVIFLGLFFDIVIYTIMLKRKSPYSIVLGGLAGAMPSFAGWTAAKGYFDVAGMLISMIILLWIPAHIWYLSMHYEEDYRRANIPMLPLIAGMERASWIIVFSVALMLFMVTLLFLVLPFGPAYFITSVIITTYFLYRAIVFAKAPSRIGAKSMYKLASKTLGVIYLAMVIGSLHSF